MNIKVKRCKHDTEVRSKVMNIKLDFNSYLQ